MNAPITLTAEALAERLAGGSVTLVDVREAWELALARIDGCVHIPLGELADRLQELDRDADTVVLCHHGVRSDHGARLLLQAGFTRVSHLGGGIQAWSERVDPQLPTY